MAYLFAHDATRQSIRLGLAGAWSYDYPVLQEPLKLLENLCPKLTKSFLLLSERDDVDILDEAATDEVDEPQVVEDEMHTHVSVTVKGFCLTGRNPFNLSRHMNFRKERLYPRFFRALRASFATDYNIRGIVAFKDRRLRWKQRLAFNDQCVFP
jgi:hypothetical protein